MDIKTQSTVDRVYEDYEPYYEWAKDEGRFTFFIPGYRRDQLKIQVTSKPALKLKGERQIIDNRWRRFDVEFPIPSDYDLESVSAKFEGGRLLVKFAKLKETTKTPEEETSRPKEELSQKVDQQNAAQEGTPKAKEDEAEAKTNNQVSDQKTPQNEKEKQPSDEKEKTKTETADSIEKEAKKEDKTTNGITEKTEKKGAATSKAPETKGAKPLTRFKTRLLDFTPGLGPSKQVYNEELEDLDAGPSKRKRLVNCGLLTLLVVGLGLYAKNTFMSSHEGSKFKEL